MEGKILGNRYELLEKVGGGGMALVYKAKCRLLNRFVAVKILRPEFTNDEEFVKRFLIEAQSVARLSHPNIVSIYDVGHENGMHYIVMEYVQGITLKELIKRKGVLKWAEAVNISIQICSAIEHAHRNHIVHRDIKPHNIMITDDGIAKVTDFGIARAVSTSTITMAGNTVGSVHYFSPEQARGGYIGEKSDIYSMGICLYEMITGNIPFDGETPVTVALKHIQEQPTPPIDINSSIPKSLNDLVMKAIRKEPDRRYQTATAMLQDLYKVSREPVNTVIIDEEPDLGATRRVNALGEKQILESENLKAGDDLKKKNVSKVDKKTIWIAIATCAVVVVAFVLLMVNLISPTTKGKDVFEVQNYIGMDYVKVKSDLEAKGISVKITRKDDDNSEKDTIIAQSVEPKKTLKPGGYIELTVSNGAKMVKIPDVSKGEYRQAETKLKELDLFVKIEDEFHDSIPEGFVTRTDPQKDSLVKAGSSVVVYRSKGPEIKDTKVPDLKGKTRQEAMKAIAEAKLSVGTILPEDVSLATAKVISQEPAANSTVKEQTAINFTLEKPVVTPTPTPGKTISEKISLRTPDAFGDKIKVRIEVQTPSSNKLDIIMNETKNKTDFPLTVNIPVEDKGKTKVAVYLDDRLYDSFTRP